MSTCDKCGAEVPEGVENCSECGEPIAAAADAPVDGAPDGPESPETSGAAEESAAVLSEVSEAEAFDEGPSIADGEPVEPEGVDRRVLIYGIVAALALVLIGGFAFWSVGRTVSNDPANVTRQTLEAYANYDMAKILTLTTHDSIPPDQSNQLLKLGEDAKAKSGGKLGLKNVRVGKVTMDGADSAKVEVTFDQLQTSGTYSPITEVFVVIRRKGQWLVQLF